MHAVSNPIVQTSTTEGHLGSKFIVPIQSGQISQQSEEAEEQIGY